MQSHRIASMLLVSLCFTGCAGLNESEMYTKTEELFGTYVTVKLYPSEDGGDPETALNAAFERARALEQIFSPTAADSELNAVNAAAFSQDIAVSEELQFLLEQALYYHGISDGALDCTMGELIDLWGIGTEDACIPPDEEIMSLLPVENGVMLSEDGLIRFTDEDVQLQFGAIAKGYIADAMKEELESQGIQHAVISLGGNVLTIGDNPAKQSRWSIGITDPFAPEQIAATVQAEDVSVVTSGNYERYFEENGVRYHHILNPETGYPAESGVVSTTIIAESSLTCDALSTAAYVLGPEKGMELIESLEGVEAVFITEEREFLLSSGMKDYEFEQVSQ